MNNWKGQDKCGRCGATNFYRSKGGVACGSCGKVYKTTP